jgi:hypothetical protein
MSVHSYKDILEKAKSLKSSVEKSQEYNIDSKWTYYFAKAILNPKKDIKRISFDKAPKPSGTYISRQIGKDDYIELCKYLCNFVEDKGRLPNFIKWNGYNIRVRDYSYAFARILVYYDTHKALPKYVNVNSKAYTQKSETANSVYNYFVQVFGKIDCIDDALDKISSRGYGYYYDDVYSNKQSIDRMKNRQGVNCTDSCQVFYNICLGLIQRGIYKKVECIHVKCRGGDGHVRLRITNNKGQKFYRDPACTLSDGGYCNWCMDGTVLAVDPSWFMANLNR